MIRLATLPFALLLVAAGCSAPAAVSDTETASEERRSHPTPPDVTDVKLGDVFTLEQGSSIVVDGQTIRFDEVTEDSRCPANVDCVWEGRASVNLMMIADDTMMGVQLSIPGFVNIDSEPRDIQSASAQGYTLTLLQLNPYPDEEGVDAEMTPSVTLRMMANG